ncbi:hypothetical protein [Micromonospora sp. NPDC005174]|uniref:hypothetical protein n=1 Tax=Micromonospora sp. NPDC005174 TaxID=3157018 RepID=UPI0033A8D4B8
MSALAAHRDRAAKLRAQLDDKDVEMVAACRNAGVTWREIGAVFGVTEVTVIKKYNKKLTIETRVRPKTSSSEEKP